MKHIYLNLKRFDIPPLLGGVNRLAPVTHWAKTIINGTDSGLKKYQQNTVDFTMFFPEAHLISAVSALSEDSILKIGSQSVYREDTAPGANFGAFTSHLTANAAQALGCTATLIGHCEERKDKQEILKQAGVKNKREINTLLNQSIERAVAAELAVLYCIGETADEQDNWQTVLKEQLTLGLKGINTANVTIAYEPIWAIGPGKTPPDRDYIRKIAAYVKEVTGGLDVVYGGGLKVDNAAMLASISEIDGGLIALTRFSGEIGFYPQEYLEIIAAYFGQ